MSCLVWLDLDDSVRSGGLGKIFEEPTREVTPAVPKINRFFRSVTVRMHRDADGVQMILFIFRALGSKDPEDST